jgi:dihydroorotase
VPIGCAGLTRREMLMTMGSSVIATLDAPAALADPDLSLEEPSRYDLLIKGGKVIDASQRLEMVMDVAVASGKIAHVAPDIPANQARQVIRAEGKLVTPGLIDIHTHVFPFVGPYGIEADQYCLHNGVTTVVDAGTSGEFSFPAFRRYDIERASTRIRALLHVVSIGMIAGGTPNMGELEDLRYCVPKLAVECARQNADVILGFKIRFSKDYTGPNDVEGMKRAREAADEAGLPLMCHIAGPYSPLHTFLTQMRKGDIWTHCFNARAHGILDANGKVKEEALEARSRGVRFDVGHGAGSFSFDVAAKCLEQGFPPDTISTDLYTANIHGPVYDMPTTMSKFLILGMPLSEILRRTTANAVESFSFDEEIGTLKPGAEADVSVFEIEEGDFTFTDSYGKTRQGRQKLRPVVTIRAGEAFYPIP